MNLLIFRNHHWTCVSGTLANAVRRTSYHGYIWQSHDQCQPDAVPAKQKVLRKVLKYECFLKLDQENAVFSYLTIILH
jgi:hypothetical protein